MIRAPRVVLAGHGSDVLFTIREPKHLLHHRSRGCYHHRAQSARRVLAQSIQLLTRLDTQIGKQHMKEQYSQSNVHVGDTLICAATAAMVIPSSGAHLRKVEFRFPRFTNKPTVTATIHSDETTENVFSVLAIKINDLGDQTKIAITATNVQTGVPVPFTYLCSVVVVGKARQMNRRPARA